MAMFINPNDPNRNKPLVQTYDPVAGTSTGLKPYTAKPAVSSNPVPSPAPAPTPRPSPTARPTKVVGRNPVNTTPKFKSELYDKTVEAKKLSVVNPVTNPEKFTSAERGALAFHMPDYLDRFKAVVENVKAGKATLPTVKQVKRAELIRFRDGQDYMTARDILSASTEEDERRYGLIKQARSVQSTIGMADDTEFPRIAKTLYEITNELDGRTDAPAWSDDYLKNPSLMQTMDDMLSNYEGQYAPLAYAEGVVEKGEKLKKDADWFDNLDTPYQAMDVQERKLYQQNIAFEYAQGKKPIMFDLPDEYLKAEQENIDLNGLTEIAPGQSLPQFMVIADKNEQEVREQASILEDILATDHGALGDKARKNIEFDLDSLNDQLTAIDGFRYRYENANIKADAAEGEKAWRVDMEPYAVSTSEDYESMFAFEDRWAKKLAENPNNKALIAQKEQEQLKLGATINRDKAGREILGYEDQYSDYYLVPVMTDQERATYMSYYKTDKAKAHEYAMALDQTLNKRASFELSELTKKLASGTIWEQGLSAVGSVLTTVMKGISAIGIITKGITNQKIDPYAAYMEPAIVQQDIRGQLKKNTETAFGKDSIPTKSINLIGDILFGASDTIVGGKTLGFAGYMISGGSDSARDALLRGGNQDQALALMAANVAAEAITEAIPFDAIMGGFKKGFTWRGLFTSGFGEFVGEGASSLLGSEADKEIMLEKSYYETDVKEIEREKKISREEAEKIANKNILKDALYEGIVGLGSGDLAYMVSTRGRRAPKDTSAENAEVAKALDDADLGAAITGIITEYDAGENAPEAEQTEGQNPTTALEEQAAIDEASHEPDHTPQRPETPAQQPISEQGAGETRAEDNQIAPQTAREYEDNDEVKAARAAYEAATAKVNEAIANGVLKPDAEWAAQDAAYQALNDAIDRQGQARIADEQARNPILNPAAEQTEVSSEPVQPADTSLVDALSKEYPVQTIPVEGIKVSPQEYQFKANVDETGVKDKIEGNYIPSYAGTVVVHERADGTRYIADGHHRLSLAARSGIKELQAIVLREADGVTTAMARAFAAARNIASSRGTSIDAAKVFKETGITAEGLYALGLSPNEKNVSEGIALSQVDPQLFDRIAQDEIPLKAGVLIGQIFPNDGTMQREFLRKMAGRNLSYDAMTELANVLKNAREVAATQEQVGFDFLDDPALTNAAEIAEVAARVKNMLARTLSTFKGLSGGKKVDQVGAVGGNEIDTEANRAEADIALDAEIIMRTYWAADSPAFKLIDELAAQYAEGKLTLPKAAEQAYNAVSKIARDAINASKVDAAHGPAADSVAILIGTYGADRAQVFFNNVLSEINSTGYDAQQQTMRNIRDAITLPIEAQARQILDNMITNGKFGTAMLGLFNVAAQQDLANPIYADARASAADELSIANQTAKDIQAGAMQGFDERNMLVKGLEDKAITLETAAEEAKVKHDKAKAALTAFNQESVKPGYVVDENFKKTRSELKKQLTAAKAEIEKAVSQAKDGRKAADSARAKFDADYAAQLTAIREKAIVSSQKAPNEQGAPLISVDDTIPVSEKERPKSPKKGQKQGTPVQAMYTNGRNATSQDTAPLTPEQIEYFKDSKVRDAQGRLLKVYHGTTREFTEFKTNTPGQTIKDTIGSHFGTEKAASDRLSVVGKEKSPYGENKPSVMSVFLNITNPLLKRDGGVMTESELNAYLKRVGKKLNIPERELGNSSQFSRVPSYVGETIQAYLKEQGYDGIPYINSWEDRGNVSYIAFSPEQIKSTTNLTPTSSPDIRYMYNVTTGGLPISAPTVDYSGPVQSAQTIFTKLGKAIGVPFNVNRRQYMRGLRNTTAGYFIPKSEVVHVKNAQDLTAASHEFGHWVDKRTRIGSHPAILRIVSQLMNDPVFSQNYTPQELNGEAVAEAMKVYMVNREQALAHLGKDFVAELEKGLSELGVLKEFDAARAALGRTIGASTFEQIKARIVSADESGERTVKERIRNIRAKTFDSTLVFDEMSKMLRGLRGNNYMMSEDPRMIALKNNRIDNFVKAIIEDRLVNVRGDTILGRGFADNFEGISANEIKAFEAYLIAYHDLDRTKVGKSALGGEFTRQQILSTIAEVEAAHPGWKNNKAMLHEWYDAFFKEYIVKQGVIAQGEYDNMKAMYPNYVPTYRQMGDDAKGAPNKSSGDVKKGLLGAKESDLNIINPIESMARLIMTYTQQAHRLQLGNVFADAIDKYDATGVFAENIQKDIKHRPEIAAIKSEIEQMIAQQEEARQTTLFDSPLGENPDLEKFDQNVLSLLDRSMFTMENTATGANVINILGRDGRYRSYLVHDANMLSVLQSVPSVQLTKVLQWTKNIVGMISATATGTNPFFALTNGVRDMAMQMIYGTTSTNVLTAVPKWILNLPRTIAGILSNTTINGHQVLKDNRYTDAYRLYSMFSETGARYSAQIGKTSQTMVEALTSPNAAKKAGKAALKVFTMQFLNEMVENNSRFLEFYSGKSSLGKNRDNLNTFEGRLRAGLAASGVTVDFRRSGASPIMREIGAIVPFFNAGIQGINKAASLFTNENTGRRGQIAAKIALNMTMLGVLQAVMNNMHLTDDEKEEYETFDEGYKAKSLFLKVGPEKLLRIPMTQDPISLIFYALGRAVGGAATGEGTSVADALVNGAKAVLTESTNFSTIYSPIQNLIENKTWYGSAIESSMMKGYARTERYNERTTGIAKWLSEKTGFLSPVQWDYIIPQYTGVWGKLGLNFVRNATGDATVGEALLETLNKEVSSRMFTTPAYTSQLYNNYKASLDGITQVKNHYRDNRPFSMFDPNLTQDELNLAVTEAHRMTKKGGELYDISEQISAKWDAYNQVLSNASLTDEQRDQGTIAVRQEINQLSLKGQNIIAGYESKYFPGAVRTNERVIGFNVREMTAQGVKEASSMTQTVYDDLQSGKPYAKDYADYSKGIYEKWGSEYILTTKPSKTWKGFNESTASPEKLAAIDRVYFTVVANGLKAQNQAILNAKSAEEADKLIKAITRKAADAAKEEALR